MCILSGIVKNVSNTKLFAMPSCDSKRQLTIYANSIDSPSLNNMCLPLPNPDSLKFETIPKDIFKQCEDSFPKSKKASSELTLSWKPTKSIRIVTHGSYEVAIVPTMGQLDEVPDDFMNLSPYVKEFLQQTYPNNFGILLCKVKKGQQEYEPFAYSHELYENKLFLPTKHYHIHQDTDFLMGYSINQNQFIHADWDHSIYLYNTPIVSKDITPTNVIEWNKMPNDFCVDPDFILQKIERYGNNYPNTDILIPLTQ